MTHYPSPIIHDSLPIIQYTLSITQFSSGIIQGPCSLPSIHYAVPFTQDPCCPAPMTHSPLPINYHPFPPVHPQSIPSSSRDADTSIPWSTRNRGPKELSWSRTLRSCCRDCSWSHKCCDHAPIFSSSRAVLKRSWLHDRHEGRVAQLVTCTSSYVVLVNKQGIISCVNDCDILEIQSNAIEITDSLVSQKFSLKSK